MVGECHNVVCETFGDCTVIKGYITHLLDIKLLQFCSPWDLFTVNSGMAARMSKEFTEPDRKNTMCCSGC